MHEVALRPHDARQDAKLSFEDRVRAQVQLGNEELKSEAEVNAFYEAAMTAGATDNGKPGVRLYYDPRYYAANVFDPDGYSLEAVYKSWQHPQS